LSVFLTEHAHRPLEVPTWRIDQLRRSSTGRKTDHRDAELAARVAHTTTLAVRVRPQVTEALRVLRNYRDSLVRDQTRSLNRIHALFTQIDPQRAASLGRIRSTRALKTLRRVQYRGDPYRQTISALIRTEALHGLNRRQLITTTEQQLTQLLPDAGHKLMEITGIGLIGAATLLGEIGDINRFPTPAAFAAWAGTAPLDASSGRQQRHRLNRRGNRQVNRVLETAILTQLKHHGRAHTYTTRKLEEGKTKREAIRAAKRHLTTHIYRTLKNQTKLT
jgi:transposase